MAIRVPQVGASWQYQLDGEIDVSVDAEVFDIDVEETSADVVAELHRRGRYVIGYLDAGAVERYRSDFGEFPTDVVGKKVESWSDERWLDIRRLDVLLPIMGRRMDLAVAKGFDAIEADMVEAYTEKTGFRLTAADQLTYNRALARLAHERGLAIGLKNDLEQVPDLVGDFDFAINEQCFEYDESDALLPFIRAGKPVFHVEYDLPLDRFAEQARSVGFSSIRKHVDLDARRWAWLH
ncbi:endo alpha-1,4 polygalactosaminidase [Pseudonocardiaceae bacterium YIM PH 21723]|nr:endo alpha-1,4 polygalactosaminidase [Pseudonocardiaceae bacterium YIM PH 21723]